MICILFITVYLWMPGLCLDMSLFKFHVSGALTDKVCPPDSRMFEAEASSLVLCVAIAAEKQITSCFGVSFHNESKMCYGCYVSVDTTGDYQPLPGSVFYEYKGNALFLSLYRTQISLREFKPGLRTPSLSLIPSPVNITTYI